MKKVLWSALILIVAAIIFGLWASRVHAPAPAQSGDILSGVATSTGLEHLEDTDLYHIDITYPAHMPLQAGADAQARATVEQGLADLVAQFKQDGNFANLTSQDIAYQNITPDHKYALIADYKAFTSTSTAAASYLFTVYEDTLGAHPNGYFKTFVFDQNGNQLSLAQVLGNNPNWLEELSLLVSDNVVAQIKQRLGSSLPQGPEGPDATGVVYQEGLSPNEDNFSNFVVDGSDLVIEIPPYQVAAYAMGSFEVRVPLSAINK